MKKINFRDIIAEMILITSIVVEWSKNIIGIPLIILWILFAYLKNKTKFCEFFLGRKKMVLSVYLWLFVSILLYMTQNQYMSSYAIKNIIRIAFNILIFGYYFYEGNRKTIKKMCIIALITITIIMINTISNLIKYPNLSRILATENPEKYEGYINIKGIGSYGFIYGIVFLGITFCCTLKLQKITIKNKLFILIYIFIILMTLIYAQFTISIILTVLGITLNILNVGNLKKLVLIAIILILAISSFNSIIVQILDTLADNVEQYELSQRIIEIRNFIENKNIDNSSDLESRITRYNMSFRTFCQDFLGLDKGKKIGGHSQILDEYAKYGVVIATITFLPIIMYMKWIYKVLNSKRMKKIWYINCVIYFLLSLINTSMFIVTMILLLFCVPSILYSMEGEKNENSLDCEYHISISSTGIRNE